MGTDCGPKNRWSSKRKQWGKFGQKKRFQSREKKFKPKKQKKYIRKSKKRKTRMGSITKQWKIRLDSTTKQRKTRMGSKWPTSIPKPPSSAKPTNSNQSVISTESSSKAGLWLEWNSNCSKSTRPVGSSKNWMGSVRTISKTWVGSARSTGSRGANGEGFGSDWWKEVCDEFRSKLASMNDLSEVCIDWTYWIFGMI